MIEVIAILVVPVVVFALFLKWIIDVVREENVSEIKEQGQYVESLTLCTVVRLEQDLKALKKARREAIQNMPDMRLKHNRIVYGGVQDYMEQCKDKYDKRIEAIKQEMDSRRAIKRPCNKTSAGLVYFIGAFGRVKIGRTNDLDRRLAELQTGCPTKMELLHSIETPQPHVLETKLHRIFAHKRLIGEWFDLGAEDLLYIKSHLGLITSASTELIEPAT